jgi:predicted nucleic acid-binding protein
VAEAAERDRERDVHKILSGRPRACRRRHKPSSLPILIEHTHVLPALYGEVLVPPAVVAELTQERTPREVRTWLANKPEWLRVEAPRDTLPQLRNVIDTGEREAIALAVEMKADALLIDDRDGRREAEALSLPVLGTLRVLSDAAQHGFADPSLRRSPRSTVDDCGPTDARFFDTRHGEGVEDNAGITGVVARERFPPRNAARLLIVRDRSAFPAVWRGITVSGVRPMRWRVRETERVGYASTPRASHGSPHTVVRVGRCLRCDRWSPACSLWPHALGEPRHRCRDPPSSGVKQMRVGGAKPAGNMGIAHSIWQRPFSPTNFQQILRCTTMIVSSCLRAESSLTQRWHRREERPAAQT